jgi:hypothetical protein
MSTTPSDIQVSVLNQRLPEDMTQILLSRANWPVFDDEFGDEPMKKCGKVLKLGKCYSEWNHHPEIPPKLQEWAESQGLEHCNSIVVQVFDDPKYLPNIHYFYHDCRALFHSTLVANRFTEGKVTSLWFALREEDKNNDNILAISLFKNSQYIFIDGSCTKFDAFNGECNLSNYKMKPLKPCLNIIFRCLT